MILFVAMVVLMLILAAGLVRSVLGPTLPDRLLALQLLGTGGVALLLMMAPALGIAALIDVALVLAVLAIVLVAALTGQVTHHD